MGAIGIEPGAEVIVPPWTMSATVVSPLLYGGVPVFADIEPETFGLDPDAVSAKVTERTEAIVAVNLFGHPARLAELREIADRHDLLVIEDNAQGPLAEASDGLAGTLGDVGVFSLNYHKHIHTGEGGVCVTDDPELARRLQLIRNHGENVVEPMGIDDLTNLVGFNFRMTEMAAAVGLHQLEDTEEHVSRRERVARELTRGTEDLDGLTPPKVRDGCRHTFYMWALRVDPERLGVSRRQLARALQAEGFPVSEGYVDPLYELPLFQQRSAFGGNGHPISDADTCYAPGICPVVERLHGEETLLFQPPMYDLDETDAKQLVEAIRKVHGNRNRLANADLEAEP
jgi:dTDP-4-amino-4,6-dideoxygalactose transaminase